MPTVSPSGGGGGTTMTGWTTDANGNTIFAPTDPLHNGWLIIRAPAGADVNETDAVYIEDEHGVRVGTFACDGGLSFAENPDSTDGFQFRIGPASNGFGVRTPGSVDVIRVDASGHLGFFNVGPVAQQAVTSGSVTPAQLANALQASGVLGGT